MSNIDGALDRLQTDWKVLQSEWAQCRSEWRDAVADQFEQEYWNQWESLMPKMLGFLSELDNLLSRIPQQTSLEE